MSTEPTQSAPRQKCTSRMCDQMGCNCFDEPDVPPQPTPPQPEPKQSAVEWTKPRMVQLEDGEGRLFWVMLKTHVDELAERCDAAEAQLAAAQAEAGRLREALEWYGEQARLARLIHSEGDAGRNRLADDGGKKARAALAKKEGQP